MGQPPHFDTTQASGDGATGARHRYALTVWQPWAGLIMAGIKDVENRTWRTSYRGPLLIHAGSGTDEQGMEQHADEIVASGADVRVRGILGTVNLVDVARNHSSAWALPDCWHWVLQDPRRLVEPVPARGMPGLWRPNDDVLAAVRGALCPNSQRPEE
jgi:hypothetical protein